MVRQLSSLSVFFIRYIIPPSDIVILLKNLYFFEWLALIQYQASIALGRMYGGNKIELKDVTAFRALAV